MSSPSLSNVGRRAGAGTNTLVALLSLLGRPVAAAPIAAADDAMLWVVQSGLPLPEGGLGCKLIWTPADIWFDRPALYPIRRGEILRATVLDGELIAFFADGSFWRFSRSRSTQELRLPGGSIPAAVAGEHGRNTVLAVVPARVAVRVVEENARLDLLLAENQPVADEGEPATTAPAAPQFDPGDARWFLIRYAPRRWEPVAPLPAFADVEGLAWLLPGKDHPALFWRPEVGAVQSDIRFTQRVGEEWTDPESIPQTAALFRCSVGRADEHPVLIGLQPVPAVDAGAHVAVNRRQGEIWSMSLLEGFSGRPLEVYSTQTAVTLCRGRVFVYQGDPKGEGQWASWSLDGTAETSGFSAVRELPVNAPGFWSGRGLEVVGYTLLVALILLVFVRRQESLLKPADLAPGLVLAGYGRRALAMVLDGLPALAITLPLWIRPLAELAAAYPQQAADPAIGRALRVSLWVPFLYPRIVYTLYCTIWELSRGTTPGKMVSRIALVSTNGGPCDRRQIVTRNLLRLVETEPLLMIWPLLMLLVVTRNRQRLGDVWAHTLVVQRSTVPPPRGPTGTRRSPES